MRLRVRVYGIVLLAALAAQLWAQPAPKHLEVVRDAHPWEFVDAVGQKAAIFGNESGNLEGWVHPLKFFRNFHLVFNADGRALPADSLVRTTITRPESTTIVYASDNFRVRETLFAPIREPGALILIDVDSTTPVQVEAQFEPDVQYSWPASLGATYFSYNQQQRAFLLGSDDHKVSGIFGSPDARVLSEPYATNYSSSNTVSLNLGDPVKGHKQFAIAWALSLENLQAARNTYDKLLGSSQSLIEDAERHYEDYLANTVGISVPDKSIESAYDWSRVAMLQGMVDSPGDGYGIVAGYRTSFNYRAGFDWFFGRDSMWTSLALLKEGDFANVKAALDFLTRFQRADGKIPHEIAHQAEATDWFKRFQYGFASADATPLYLIVAREYARTTGDTEWVKQNWNHLALAYTFLLSTRNNGEWPKNVGVGHGWIEGGPLLPIATEFYQAGLATEAADATAELAKIAAHPDVEQQASQLHEEWRKRLDTDFWSDKVQALSFGIDNTGKPTDRTTVLEAAPLWWPLVSDAKAQKSIDAWAQPEITSDWGSRLFSNHDPLYDPVGYHYGSVWPLYTGWVAATEYSYHRPLEAYQQLRSNVLLTEAGEPGHVTEVLAGEVFSPLAGSTPHQIWSSAMVVSPILRGLFGITTDASGRVVLASHFPATWNSAGIDNLQAGAATVAIEYSRRGEELEFRCMNSGKGAASVVISPSIALSASLTETRIGGHTAKNNLQPSSQDQHVSASFELAPGATQTVTFQVKNDFGVEYQSSLPPSGFDSKGLRIVHEQWARNSVTLTIGVQPGKDYDLEIGGDAPIASVDNATVVEQNGRRVLHISVPASNSETYETKQLTVHFRP